MSDLRTNAGFVITNAIPIGNKEFVLGVNMKNATSFVTWECREKTDYYWGHYNDNLLKATKDLCQRVVEEIEYLEQRQAEQQEVRREADIQIRPMTQEEQIYTYKQSKQLEGQTGSIGHLQGDFGESGNEFNHTWNDHWTQYRTERFETELNEIVNVLCSEKYGLLSNRKEMAEYAEEFPDSAFIENGSRECGFRVDTSKHVYLIRCCPSKGEYNIYCYVAKFLDRHMGNARQGIRFIEPGYKEKFRIPDGGKIVVTTASGKKREHTCRFIDEYHTEVGRRLYHICEFAERMHRNGAMYEPKLKESQKQKAKRNHNQER